MSKIMCRGGYLPLFFTWFATIVVCVTAIFSFQQANAAICIQTFNVFGPYYSTNTSMRTYALAQEIERSNCEIFLLQELWRDSHMDLLHARLGQSSRYGIVFDTPSPERIGLALAFNKEAVSLLDRRRFVFSQNTTGILDRIRVFLNIKKGFYLYQVLVAEKKYLLVNVHLHHGSAPLRLAQLMEVYNVLMNTPLQGHLIIAGDFNARIEAPEMQVFLHLLNHRGDMSFIDTGMESCTYCGNNPIALPREDMNIDHILYSSALQPREVGINFQEVAIQPFGRVYPSDHYGKFAVFSEEVEIGRREYALKPEVIKRGITLLRSEGNGNRYHKALDMLKSLLNKM